jgi:hypothetical protein
MIHNKISRILLISLIVTSMPTQGWWLSDWLFNKPTPPTITIERASKDLLTVATVLTGAVFLSGYWLFAWHKKQQVKQQQIIQNHEIKISQILQENNQLTQDRTTYQAHIQQIEDHYRKHEQLAQNLNIYAQSLKERERNLSAREDRVRKRAEQNESDRQNLRDWQTTLNRTQTEFESMILSVSQVCKAHRPTFRRTKSWGSFKTGQPLNGA